MSFYNNPITLSEQSVPDCVDPRQVFHHEKATTQQFTTQLKYPCAADLYLIHTLLNPLQ